MPKTVTAQGYANVDPLNGSLTVDLRPFPTGSGLFIIDGSPNDFAVLAAPAAPTADVLASVAGAPGGARFAKVGWAPGAGRQSLLSPATSAGTAAANFGAHVASPVAYNPALNAQPVNAAPNGVGFYDVYFSTTLGGTYTKQNTTPIAIGTDYTETAAGVLSNGAAPAADSTGFLDGACTVTVTQP